MKCRLLAAFVGLALTGLPTLAQGPAAERRVFPVTVAGAYGKVVRELTAADFRARYRGQPARVLSVALDSSPRRVAVLIDITRSMESRRALPLAWAAAEDLIPKLVPPNRVALFTLGRELEKHSDFTDDPAALLKAVEAAKARGAERPGLPLLEAVRELAEKFPRDAWGGALFLISDAQGEASGESWRLAQEALARAGLRVFVAWVNEFDLRWLSWKNDSAPRLAYLEAVNLCMRLAEVSGGLSVQLPPRQVRPDQVPGSLGALYLPLRTLYRVEVEFASPVEKADDWELELVDEQGQPRKGVVVAYPRRLLPLK